MSWLLRLKVRLQAWALSQHLNGKLAGLIPQYDELEAGSVQSIQ
jgi:hypothetical protein